MSAKEDSATCIECGHVIEWEISQIQEIEEKLASKANSLCKSLSSAGLSGMATMDIIKEDTI